MSQSADVIADGNAPVSEESSRLERAAVSHPLPTAKACYRVPRGHLPTPLADVLVRLYRWQSAQWRSTLRSLVTRTEGGEMFSQTLRRIFREYYQVDVGLYSHGGCFVPGNMAPRTIIGRYSSIAATACTFTRNHPMNVRSSHALFFNPELGFTQNVIIPHVQLTIGNDVWIGHNAVILPSVSSIADGAVIGAGAVVNKNVPTYAVATGNPCRIVRYRFSESVIAELLASRWWERSLEQLLPELWRFQRPLEYSHVR